VLSLSGLIFLFPFLLVIAVLVGATSPGGIFYLQTRVGRRGKDFRLIKFRTMRTGAEKKGLLTVGVDPRITPVGFFLRKYKLDELPQLINVLTGSMSLVGPRPEVRKYVELYTPDQAKILEVKPGITDYASLEYFNENDMLASSGDPEQTYIHEVMPAKLKLNSRYIAEAGLATDLRIIFATLRKIFNA
jgi:lipopolysaccharide/colanic/teichoic acid biosynthesis glycosyltransferase